MCDSVYVPICVAAVKHYQSRGEYTVAVRSFIKEIATILSTRDSVSICL